MKRIRIRPGKVIYISDELAAKAAKASQSVGLTKRDVDDILKAAPRNLPPAMFGPRREKPSLRRSPGTAKVFAKVLRILEETGSQTPVSTSDVERWVDIWMQTHQPALHGKTPAAMMRLPGGWDQVEPLLEHLRDGGFA
jgi:uncharacterized protein (DUF2384 family)